MITNSITPEILESTFWMYSAKEIWDELHELYHQGFIFRISDLQEEIYALKQGDQNITQNFTTLKKLWQKMIFFYLFHHAPATSVVHVILYQPLRVIETEITLFIYIRVSMNNTVSSELR